MLTANHIAFKEWAVICAALAEGLQTLILRKGGIQEGRDGFQVEHREFWLFPTYLHQNADGLIEEVRPLLDRVRHEQPPSEIVRIHEYAVVQDVIEVHEPAIALNLASLHVWSHRTVDQRFCYKQPGLFVLPSRIYRLRKAFELPDSEYFAGCRSWVELPVDLSTAGAEPVLSDEQFDRQLSAIQRALNPVRLA
jgi:hypothetical protein